MSILTVKNLNHGFGARSILEDVEFRLLPGDHIGLVGANGEGKSTFLNIITRKLLPDEGSIEWAKRVRVSYLDQQLRVDDSGSIKDVLKTAFQFLFDLETEMNQMFIEMADADEAKMQQLLDNTGEIQTLLEHHDFYQIDAKIEEVARGLGITDLGMDTAVKSISGGQLSKVLLAKLLLEKPDILLLDEPTNHLDEIHVTWLKRYLSTYENAFIVISHDTDFLDEVVNLIYHIDNKKLMRYVGNYQVFTEQRAAKQKQLDAAYKRQQQEIAQLEDFVARNKARVSTRNMAMSRQKKLDKMDRIERTRENPKPEFNFKYGKTPYKEIFEAKALVIGYDSALSKPMDLKLERGQKIAITGANGLGKTTLLKSLLGLIPAFDGNIVTGHNLDIGYFEQEVKGENRNTCIDEIWQEFPSMTQFEVRASLAKCGLTTDRIESLMMVLSGGENAKVRLCKLINRESNVLLLDEPSNHLDVEAKEELKRALIAYPGTILLISHEPTFYQPIVSDIWNLEQYTNKIV